MAEERPAWKWMQSGWVLERWVCSAMAEQEGERGGRGTDHGGPSTPVLLKLSMVKNLKIILKNFKPQADMQSNVISL